METILVCSGVVNNRDIVNCPLRNKCLRFTTRPVRMDQNFIKPDYYEVDHNFECDDYLEEIKCCGMWDDEGKCKCKLDGKK